MRGLPFVDQAAENACMKLRILFASTWALVLAAQFCFAAPGETWAGEYADKKFLNGSATFQLTIEESGNKIQVSFDAVNNNGQGCAPEAKGTAKENGKDRLQFSYRDSEGNAGNGTITRAGDDLVVSLKTTKMVKQDCAKFYREGIRLKRVE
jgi:hypothetical protein